MNKESIGYWAGWMAAAGVRAVKTMAQSLVALIGTNAVSIVCLDWAQMLGVAATAGVLSLLTSLAGLPEVDAVIEPHEIDLDELEGE